MVSSRPGSRSISALDIPVRVLDEESTFYGGDPRLLVGSPDQLPPSISSSSLNIDREQTPPSHISFLTPPRRPPLKHRSVSAPHKPGMLTPSRRGTNVAQRITSGLMRLSPGGVNSTGGQTARDQWTLFGQMMENEGQLRSPESHGIRRKPSYGVMTARPEVGSSTENQSESTTDPFLDTNIQSPTADTFLEEHSTSGFPFRGSRSAEQETDYDSDSSSSSVTSVPDSPPQSVHRWFTPPRLPTVPILYRSILKCGVAYFVGSLFTFSPLLSGILSDVTAYGSGERTPAPSGHMVATVAVYFHPAQTMGGMVEADMFCFMGLIYSTFVCLGSMTMFWWLDVKPGWEWLADLIAILWIGLAVSALAWMKVWMAKPSFNTACSMTVIIIFIVLVMEGGLQTLLQVSFIVLIGVIVSNLVCYSLWPQSATENLQNSMAKTLDSFSTVLQMLTSTFLLEEPLHQSKHGKLQRAVENHQSSFTTLKKNLKESHSERFYGGSSDEKMSSGKAYEDAVDSLNRLAQHLNGLRSGTRLQYELTKAHSDGKVVLKNRTSHKYPEGEDRQEFFASDSKGKGAFVSEESEEANVLLQAAAAMFGDLVDDLGPPLRALSTSCTSSLKRLRESFVHRRHPRKKAMMQPQEFHQLVSKIERALFTFESTSNHAVLRLYRKSEISESRSRESMNSSVEENSVLLGNESEQVFLVYFFIFTLQEFAHELVSLIDAMGTICIIEQEFANRGSLWGRMLGKISNAFHAALNSPPKGPHENAKRPGLRRRFSAYFVPHTHRTHASFPKVRPHAPDTLLTPARSNLTFIGRIKQSLWTVGDRLMERDVKYAFKAGMATALLAAPAFADATRPLFLEYKGQWALISFFVVMSPTIGATNFLSVHRILGTLLGAGVSASMYTAFPDNPWALSIFGFFFSLPCFYYIITKPAYASAARFVLLTYNLTCLYCYNLRRTDISVLHIAFHRFVSVTAGVVWAAVVSRFWWPSEARRELSKALGEFCLNMGWLYTHLVTANSFSPEVQDVAREEENMALPTEATSLLPKPVSTRLNNSILEFMSMELHLQIKLIELQGLLAQAQHEPRLKGPFPVEFYRTILTSLQAILDKLHSMRCVTTREECVRQDFILPVNRQRREMVGNIILAFSMLASAFRLKAPLPPYLPPAEKSRQHLVDAIRRLDVVKNRDVKGSRQLLFFAYALTMKGVTQELEYLGRTLQNAFGVIGQTPDEFEALFRDRQKGVENDV